MPETRFRVRLQTWSSILRQRIREKSWFMDLGLFLLMMLGVARALIGQNTKAVAIFSQIHRTTRSGWMRRLAETYVVRNIGVFPADLLAPIKDEIKTQFGKRLLVLKAPAGAGEKGVLLAMFNETIRLLRPSLNLEKLLQDYTLVLEPSWSGYCHPGILGLSAYNEEIFVLASEDNDFAFLDRFRSNLIPIRLGSCDWVDPRLAEPYLKSPKEFDIVMNSTWASWKRHYVLFHMLAKARRRYRVVLIGVAWEGESRQDIETLADFYGVYAQITIREQVSYDEVMRITCSSRVSILLSLKEGSNRAVAESIFCNVPVVVLSNHVGGIRKNVVPQTGVLAEERTLETSIAELLRGSLRPRDWALKNISCFESAAKLNAILREHSLRRGRPWTKDVACRANSPESSYVYQSDAEGLRIWNESLGKYLT